MGDPAGDHQFNLFILYLRNLERQQLANFEWERDKPLCKQKYQHFFLSFVNC